MNPLQNFLQWCNRVGLDLSNKYGMLAVDNIEEGEVLFTIPRSALLHQETTKVSALLEKEKPCLESSSGWVPLLLALLYEYTSPQSHWKPYLSLWTDFKTLDHPMFCFQEPQEEDDDEDNDDDEEEEEKAPNPPMMVPMADMLNHVSKHNANLEFTPDSLKMVCVRPISKGEEVFNTYGQMANWQLLHMYGFAEPAYSSPSPLFSPLPLLLAGTGSDLGRQLLEQQWELLCQMMQEKGAIVFGKHGCLTDTELHTVLKVLCMSKEEFSEFKDNEGWEEDEEDEISLAFSNEGLPGLKASWKRLIHEAARLTMRSYGDWPEGVDSPQALMEDKVALGGLSSRQQNALQVRCGQQSILHRLMELTKS
ncbi:hypothetical protein FQN60_014436 [Etheostoma spectabile]|uniref:SET domain-containing protein n=1 Tax=Etheostoma spectabile TaxID=54343 RepID=A0A5J5D6Z5_9PERO|nr:hypothetical protein FQN60_014436 [Etheostoma spectabile]